MVVSYNLRYLGPFFGVYLDEIVSHKMTATHTLCKCKCLQNVRVLSTNVKNYSSSLCVRRRTTEYVNNLFKYLDIIYV